MNERRIIEVRKMSEIWVARDNCALLCIGFGKTSDEAIDDLRAKTKALENMLAQ